MIEKPMQWDSITPIMGGPHQQLLPAGGYVCKIVGAVAGKSRAGNQQIVLALEIAEGEHAGYFGDAFEHHKQYNSDATWPHSGCYYQRTQGDFNALGRFKGMITLIEHENPGYTWDWNEKSLIGKKVGAVFGEESYIGNDNKEHVGIRCAYLREVEGVEDAQIPKRREAQQTNTGFASSADDIPF